MCGYLLSKDGIKLFSVEKRTLVTCLEENIYYRCAKAQYAVRKLS